MLSVETGLGCTVTSLHNTGVQRQWFFMLYNLRPVPRPPPHDSALSCMSLACVTDSKDLPYAVVRYTLFFLWKHAALQFVWSSDPLGPQAS